MCQSSVLWLRMALMFVATCNLVDGEKSEPLNYETVRNSNAAILNRLGLVPLRIPEGHHKKRLAGPEPSDTIGHHHDSHTRIHQPYSRRHGHRDSHVYIVKLPPSQPYYTLTKPHNPSIVDDQPIDKIPTAKTDPQVGFHSNGKPGKIYHWNLPIVKKMTDKKRMHAKFRIEQMRKKYDIEMKNQKYEDQRHNVQSMTNKNGFSRNNEKSAIADLPIVKPIDKTNYHAIAGNALNRYAKPMKHVRNNDKRLNYPKMSEQLNKLTGDSMKLRRHENTIGNKMYRLEDSHLYRLGVNDGRAKDRDNGWNSNDNVRENLNMPHGQKTKKHRKKSATSYYAPGNLSRKMGSTAEGVKNNFSGNGKPKAFYVMEKSRQPIYYHPLLP